MQRFRFNDPVFATLERVAAPQVVAGLAVLVGFLTAIWMRRKSAEGSAEAFAWPMAASLFCAPVVYPWYLLWMLPFLQVDLDGADHGLDFEHHSYLLCLAPAHRSGGRGSFLAGL